MLEPEIRCVPAIPDGWEVVSSRRCCVFVWDRLGNTGVVFLDRRRCASCRAEVRVYATARGWRVVDDRASTDHAAK